MWYGQKYANGSTSGPLATLDQLQSKPFALAHVEGSIKCSNSVFGDPYPDHLKYCLCSPQAHYNSSSDAADFSVKSIVVNTDSGKFAADTVATVIVSGKVGKALTAGTVSYQIYQTGVTSFVASGNQDYFNCDNKGCDLTSPLALKLADPLNGGMGSEYWLSFDVTLPSKVSTSNEFRVVFWGQNQDHFPYDFSATVQFNYN